MLIHIVWLAVSLFFETSYFGAILDLCKSYKNITKSSHVPSIQPYRMSTSHITTFVKTKILILIISINLTLYFIWISLIFPWISFCYSMIPLPTPFYFGTGRVMKIKWVNYKKKEQVLCWTLENKQPRSPAEFSFQFLSSAVGIPILCLSHHCVLEAYNFIFGFTDLQLERNSAPTCIISQVSPLFDLDKL